MTPDPKHEWQQEVLVRDLNAKTDALFAKFDQFSASVQGYMAKQDVAIALLTHRQSETEDDMKEVKAAVATHDTTLKEANGARKLAVWGVGSGALGIIAAAVQFFKTGAGH